MKKTFLFSLTGIIAALLTGCSPKVTTDMFTYEHAPVNTSEVMLLSTADSMPHNSLYIGRVKVEPRSTNPSQEYVKLMGLAVREAAQNGGNVLVMDARPFKDNSVQGMIAHTDTETIDSLAYSPQRVQQLWQLRQQIQGVRLQEAEEKGIVDSIKREPYGGLVKISAGPIWTTSKIYTSSDGKNYKKGLRGYAIDCSLTNLGKKGHGFGGDFFLSRTEVDVPTGPWSVDCSYTLIYFGIHYAAGARLGKKFFADANLGLGAAMYTDEGQTEGGFGLRYAINLEYMVSKSIGIGIEGISHNYYFKRPDGFKQPDGESYGIKHLGVLMGVRFHF